MTTTQAARAASDRRLRACECSDPGCDACMGRCQTMGPTSILYRVDMDDCSGTRMCEACAADAFESGCFTDDPDSVGQVDADEVLEAVNRIMQTESDENGLLCFDGYREVMRDNVYNHENDFDRVFTFTVYAPQDTDEWFYARDVFVAVTLHNGGDPRGNYGATRLYRIDSPAESGFLDWVIGWHADPDTIPNGCEIDFERFAVGSSSSPTSELWKAFETDRGMWRGGAFYHWTCEDDAETGEPIYGPIAMHPSAY